MLAVCVITAVDVSDDLGVAKIGVRLLADSGDPKPRKELLRRFEAALPKLRRGVGAALAIRRVPELRFFYDAGHDHTRRVDELLHEIEREKTQKPG
jgi:ribosome-binding factor A